MPRVSDIDDAYDISAHGSYVSLELRSPSHARLVAQAPSLAIASQWRIRHAWHATGRPHLQAPMDFDSIFESGCGKYEARPVPRTFIWRFAEVAAEVTGGSNPKFGPG
jgi:hypothetical protein